MGAVVQWQIDEMETVSVNDNSMVVEVIVSVLTG